MAIILPANTLAAGGYDVENSCRFDGSADYLHRTLGTPTNNKIWTYPNKDATKQSIVVCNTLDECIKYRDQGVYGFCSDYIGVITPEMKIV